MQKEFLDSLYHTLIYSETLRKQCEINDLFNIYSVEKKLDRDGYVVRVYNDLMSKSFSFKSLGHQNGQFPEPFPCLPCLFLDKWYLSFQNIPHKQLAEIIQKSTKVCISSCSRDQVIDVWPLGEFSFSVSLTREEVTILKRGQEILRFKVPVNEEASVEKSVDRFIFKREKGKSSVSISNVIEINLEKKPAPDPSRVQSGQNPESVFEVKISVKTIHAKIEAEKRGFAFRTKFQGEELEVSAESKSLEEKSYCNKFILLPVICNLELDTVRHVNIPLRQVNAKLLLESCRMHYKKDIPRFSYVYFNMYDRVKDVIVNLWKKAFGENRSAVSWNEFFTRFSEEQLTESDKNCVRKYITALDPSKKRSGQEELYFEEFFFFAVHFRSSNKFFSNFLQLMTRNGELLFSETETSSASHRFERIPHDDKYYYVVVSGFETLRLFIVKVSKEIGIDAKVFRGIDIGIEKLMETVKRYNAQPQI